MFDKLRNRTMTAMIMCLCILATGWVVAESLEVEGVATWHGGVITSEDLSSWLVFQGKSSADVDIATECNDLLLVTVLAAETEAEGIDAKTAETIQATIDKVLTQKLKRLMASNIVVSEEEIDDAFSKFPKAFQKPRRLRLRNFFLAFPPGPTDEEKLEVTMRMNKFRQSLIKGENFADLAERFSESQTRFRGGLMGNVSAGQLPPAIDAIAMRLGEGELSPVIETPLGLTLIQCDQVIDAKIPNKAEVRSSFEKNLRSIKEKEQWQQLRNELGGGDTSDRMFQSKAADQARSLGLDQALETRSILTWKRRQILATEALRRRVDKRFSPPTDDEVRTYFEENSTDFISPETFEISVIRIEAGDDLQSAQSLASRLSYQLRQGEVDFAQTAKNYSRDPSAADGGKLETLTRRQVAGRGPEFMKTVVALKPGETSREFMANGSMWIVRLEGKTANKQMAFNQASAKARMKLTQQRLAELQDSIEAEIVNKLDVRVPGQ